MAGVASAEDPPLIVEEAAVLARGPSAAPQPQNNHKQDTGRGA